MNAQLIKTTSPVERLVNQLITRLKPAQVSASKPIQNRFPSVAIQVDSYPCQVGLVCLHLLIKRDLMDSLDFLPLEMPSEMSVRELLRLKSFLPGSNPKAPIDYTPLVLTHEQYLLLNRFLNKELNWLADRNTSRLFNVSVYTLDQSLMALKQALLERTKLLNWDELCNHSNR